MNKDIIILNTVLELEKEISNYLSTFLNESSNDYLYENIFSMLEDSKDMSREIYNFLYSKGYIDIEEANDRDLDKTITSLESKLKELEQ